MADAPFLDGDPGGARDSLSRRHVLAAALVVLASVGGERTASAEGKREAPRVLRPVESKVAVVRVQARGYFLRAAGDAVMVYALDDPVEKKKTKDGEEGKRLQQVLRQGINRGKAPLSPTAVVIYRAAAPRVCGSGTRAPAAGVPAATPTMPVPARPVSGAPIPAGAATSAPRGPSAG